MNDTFEKKVRAAAAAGWWVTLVAVAVVVAQWIICLAVFHFRPAWILSMWGPNTDWTFVQTAMFWAFVILKFIVWLLFLITLWLTLWARQLRKTASGS